MKEGASESKHIIRHPCCEFRYILLVTVFGFPGSNRWDSGGLGLGVSLWNVCVTTEAVQDFGLRFSV